MLLRPLRWRCEALRTCRSGFPIAIPLKYEFDRISIKSVVHQCTAHIAKKAQVENRRLLVLLQYWKLDVRENNERFTPELLYTDDCRLIVTNTVCKVWAASSGCEMLRVGFWKKAPEVKPYDSDNFTSLTI